MGIHPCGHFSVGVFMVGYGALSPVSFCGSFVLTAPSLLHAFWMVFTKKKLKLYWDKMDLWISQGFNLLLHIKTTLWLQHQTHHLLDQTIIVYN